MVPPVSTDPAIRAEAGRLLAAAASDTVAEREAKAILALYGVPVVGERLTRSADEAVAGAEFLGFPVAMKVESPDLPHKTEAGVIRLSLGSAEAVREAFAAVMDNAAKASARVVGVLVQPMIPDGIEILIGARVDPLFGPLVVVGLGGVLVELLADRAVGLAPLPKAEAVRMLRGLKGAAIFDGFRGGPAVDLAALADVVVAVGAFAADFAEEIVEIDVNPLICSGDHIVAVDALIVRRAD